MVPPKSNKRDDEEEADHVQNIVAKEDKLFSDSYQINVILLLVACWFAMTLTDWGRISSTDPLVFSAANPSVGTVSMWIIIVSQWLMFFLYIWSLIAPKLFPDRDFS